MVGCTLPPEGGRRGAIPTSATFTAAPWMARDLTLLTPEDADHSVTFSPSGAYFVDTYSRVDLPPVSVRAPGRRHARQHA